MKANRFVCFVVVMIFMISCSLNKQPEGSLPYIDITKNYAEKEIILTDIAEVTYLHLNTDNDDYLYKGSIRYVRDNTIIILDDISGSILFFSKDGNPKSRFNHYGAGPEEYNTKGRDISSLIYDETEDEIFVGAFNWILVYSSAGEYKRKIILPQGIRASIVDYDNQSLFVYDGQRQFKKLVQQIDSIPQLNDSSYFRISKTDGRVLDYVIVPSNDIDLTECGGMKVLRNFGNIRKCAAGLLLCNPETDTVFLYKSDKSLIPVFYKKPLVNNTYPKVILNHFMDIGRYQILLITKLFNFDDEIKKNPHEYYMRDKQTGELFRQKVVLPDYKGKELFISAQKMFYSGLTFNGKETLAHFELDLIELKQAYRENKLSGKLKELVAILNEDTDNNVFMLVHFK